MKCKRYMLIIFKIELQKSMPLHSLTFSSVGNVYLFFINLSYEWEWSALRNKMLIMPNGVMLAYFMFINSMNLTISVTSMFVYPYQTDTMVEQWSANEAIWTYFFPWRFTYGRICVFCLRQSLHREAGITWWERTVLSWVNISNNLVDQDTTSHSSHLEISITTTEPPHIALVA